jgi:Uma2 family endonuclease
MAPHAELKLSVEEYLAFDRSSEIKHEYLDGEIFAMVGASRAHNRLTWNLAATLDPQLRARGCEGFASDMRVAVSETGLYTYPDVVVVCGEPRFTDEQIDTLLNPTFIVEVLSPSTADYDHGRKFAHYRALPSLEVYLLIDQEEVRAELFVRQPNGTWLLSETTDPEAVLEIPRVEVSLPLARIYAGVGADDGRSR